MGKRDAGTGLRMGPKNCGDVMVLQRWPPIDSHAALLKALEEHLGYCTCADDSALAFLRDFLRLVVERSDGAGDAERFQRASERLVELLRGAGSPAMRSWFVYALDKGGLIMHGFNMYDILIMDRGRWLLDGLERFPEPPPEEDTDAEPGAESGPPGK
jgi:hypothetical protein